MRRLLILLAILLFPAIANAQYNCGANCGTGGGGNTPHAILSASHSDTTPDTIARGDTFVVKGSPLTWWRLPLGAQYKTLQANATDAVYDAVHLDQSAAITGILPKLNLPATTLFTDQSNTISIGDQDFSGAASFKLPLGPSLQPTVSARIGYDSTANRLGFGLNGAYKLILTPDSADALTGKTYNGLTVTSSTGTLTIPNGAVSTLPAGAHSLAPLDSPAFTTPSLGVASATTINKVTITAPATGSTLTIPDGVTLNAGAGGTLGSNAFNSTAFVPQTTTVAGHALSSNVAVACADLSNSAGGCSMSTTSGGDLSGTLPSPTVVKVNGVTFSASPASHTVPVITAANTAIYKSIPDCTDSTGNHLNYTQSSDLFSCGTSSSAGGGTPAGSTSDIQVNNAGSFGADAGALTWNSLRVINFAHSSGVKPGSSGARRSGCRQLLIRLTTAAHSSRDRPW
jgi:hypothetical protein